MVFAAIDIGSNAARLFIADVFTVEGQVKSQKLNLIRIPLRLGFEAFVDKKISEKKMNEMKHMLIAFKELIAFYSAQDYFACATSALRDAENGQEVVDWLLEQTGIKINIIPGALEAEIMYQTNISQTLDPKHDSIYIDVGGGSTEITVFSKGLPRISRSFDLGTIRILKDLIAPKSWTDLAAWLNEEVPRDSGIYAVGFGGNASKIQKLSGLKIHKAISVKMLKELHSELAPLSIAERMHQFDLKPDRADVLEPALQIFIFIMDTLGLSKFYAPRIGLSDGIVKRLHSNYLSGGGI